MRLVYRTGPYSFDVAERELRRDGATLEAQPKVLAALEVFLASPGRLLSRDELLDRLWPGLHVGEEALTQTIRKLRLLLGDDAAEPRYLQTVLKGGYRFVAPVERLEIPETPPADTPKFSVPPSRSLEVARPPRKSSVRLWLLAGAALGVAAVALVPLALARRGESSSSRLWNAEPRRLTSSPRLEIQPAISPDGALVAYSAAPDSATPPGELDLWLLAVTGGGSLRLTATTLDEWGARFRRDGREILFLRGAPGDYDAELRGIPAFGGAERRLAPAAGSADWSPDGTEVAIARHSRKGFEIVRRRLGDGTERRLGTWTDPPHALVWSPDGRYLAFLAGRRHWVLDATNGESRPVAPRVAAERSLSWDGPHALLSNAAWDGLDRRIARLPLAGEPEALLRHVAGATEAALAMSGGALVFTGESKQREIWRLAADGSAATPVAAPSTIEGFDLDLTGKVLVLLDWDPTPGRTPLIRQHLPSGESENLGEGLCPAVSPDGALLATFDPRPSERGLFLHDLRTGASRQLVADGGPAGRIEENLHRCPNFSPDSRRVAAELLAEDGSGELVVIDVDNGAVHRLATGRFGRPAWSPDGRRLAVCPLSDGGERNLLVLDVSSHAQTTLPIDCPFRAGPIWDAGDTLWLLVDQKTKPALVGITPAGREETRVPLALPIDPSFWGVFEVRRTADGFWWVLVERYTSDLFLLSAR